LVQETLIQVNWLPAGDGETASIEVLNLRNVVGTVTLNASLLSEHGLESKALGQLQLRPHERAELVVSATQLSPKAGVRQPASVHIAVAAEFVDARSDRKHFHPAYWHENRLRPASAIELARERGELALAEAPNLERVRELTPPAPIGTRSTTTTKLCFKQWTTFPVSENTSADYFNEGDLTARPPRGQKVEL
jgi:hypothetical protein